MSSTVTTNIDQPGGQECVGDWDGPPYNYFNCRGDPPACGAGFGTNKQAERYDIADAYGSYRDDEKGVEVHWALLRHSGYQLDGSEMGRNQAPQPGWS